MGFVSRNRVNCVCKVSDLHRTVKDFKNRTQPPDSKFVIKTTPAKKSVKEAEIGHASRLSLPNSRDP